jgi:hypothetical protein
LLVSIVVKATESLDLPAPTFFGKNFASLCLTFLHRYLYSIDLAYLLVDFEANPMLIFIFLMPLSSLSVHDN